MKIKNPICAPSTVNWCEEDYAVTPFVAEFWNSLTGVFIFLSAAYWYFTQLNADLGSSRLILIKIAKWLVVVSIGTSLFHGTLLYKYQLLDEMPMLIISMEYLNLLTRLRTIKYSMHKSTIKWLRTVYQAGNIMIYFVPFTYFIQPIFQVASFHVTLKFFETIDIILIVSLSSTLNKTMFLNIFDHIHIKGDNLHKYKSSPAFIKSQTRLREYIEYKRQISYHTYHGLLLYSSSIFLWVVERMFCDYVQFLQLHAWWHFLSSIGIYHLNMIMTFHVKANNLIDNGS